MVSQLPPETLAWMIVVPFIFLSFMYPVMKHTEPVPSRRRAHLALLLLAMFVSESIAVRVLIWMQAF